MLVLTLLTEKDFAGQKGRCGSGFILEHILSHLIPITTLQSRYHCCVHLTDAETEIGVMSLAQGRHGGSIQVQVCTTSKLPGCSVPNAFICYSLMRVFQVGEEKNNGS